MGCPCSQTFLPSPLPLSVLCTRPHLARRVLQESCDAAPWAPRFSVAPVASEGSLS